MTTFQEEIVAGIPALLPARRIVSKEVNRAPKRKDILTANEKRLALENALRYFPQEWHHELAPEFLSELKVLYLLRIKRGLLRPWRYHDRFIHCPLIQFVPELFRDKGGEGVQDFEQ